jgi:hypothetical protein
MVIPRRILVCLAAACVAVVGLQDPASADQRWVFYNNGGLTRAIGGVDGGQGAAAANDAWFAFYAEKTTSMGTCALTQIAYTGSDGWETWELDCVPGGGGQSSILHVGTTAVFARACILFSGGALACGPAVAVHDDGTPA